MTSNRAISAYAKVGLESNIAAASPHDLIIMLYRAAIASIEKARNQMQQKNVPAKGAAISRAISLIGNGLQASLNLEEGGEIARNLHDLYGYMIQRLVEANINNDATPLQEVETLLKDLLGAWESIKQPTPAATARMPQGERVAATYGRV